MKTIDSLPRPVSALALLTVFGAGALSADAAILMSMGFNNVGADINEAATAGWNGTTTGAGGSLDSHLSVTTGLKIYGDFQAPTGNKPDAFQVDNWHTNNAAGTMVAFSVAAQSSYAFSLGDGSGQFSTLIHQQPSQPGDTDMFNSVTLYINNGITDILIGSQSYTPAGPAQTLTWNIGTDSSLDYLTAATFKLVFTGVTDASNNKHGPEWNLNDGAFINFSGTVVPEPSHLLLTVLGLGFTLARRRR